MRECGGDAKASLMRIGWQRPLVSRTCRARNAAVMKLANLRACVRHVTSRHVTSRLSRLPGWCAIPRVPTRASAGRAQDGDSLLGERIRAFRADLAAPECALVHHLRVLCGHARAGAAHVLGFALGALECRTIHFALKPTAEARNRSGRHGHPHPFCFAQAHCLFLVRLVDYPEDRPRGIARRCLRPPAADWAGERLSASARRFFSNVSRGLSSHNLAATLTC